MRKQQIEVAIPCLACHGAGYIENPAYRGQEMRKRRLKAPRQSLTEVAGRMGFSKGYLSDLELGRRAWSGNLIMAYEKALKNRAEK